MPIHINPKLSAKPASTAQLPSAILQSDHAHAAMHDDPGFSTGSSLLDPSVLPDSSPPAAPPVSPVLGEKILHDQRDATLASIARMLGRRGATEGALMGVLSSINNSMCEPPLNE